MLAKDLRVAFLQAENYALLGRIKKYYWIIR
jgi:hypothetical protein